MKKRLLGMIVVVAVMAYGAGCLLPANLLFELAGDVINGPDDDSGEDIDTNGESDTPKE